MNKIKADLLTADEKVIMHVTNKFGVWGNGLAPQIGKKYPDAQKEHYRFCRKYDDDKDQLLGITQIINLNDGKILANLFAMPEMRSFSYYHLSRCLDHLIVKLSMQYDVEWENFSFALPELMGCGLAAGNWNVTLRILEEWSKKYNIDVTRYEYSP